MDHCTNLSLSDPQNEAFKQQCDHIHNKLCNYCCKLDEVFCNITNVIICPNVTLTDQQQSQVMFDVSHAVEAIHDWKAHLFRSVNQEQAKQDVFRALTWALTDGQHFDHDGLGHEVPSQKIQRTNE